MDINALRVFNSLYKLGITDEEFKEIEEEQRHTERTGLAIKCVKKGYCICVSHDEKHEILIKKLKNFYVMVKDLPKDLTNTRILFKTLITFDELPQEIYTLHEIAQYRTSDTEIRYIANNLEELKDRICDRFADGNRKYYELGELHYYNRYWYEDEMEKRRKEREREKLMEKQLKALFWLFGEDYSTFKFKSARKNIPRIIKVFSRNNRRIAIFQENEDYEKHYPFRCWDIKHIRKTSLKIKAYKPRDERYNYVSPNREVYIGSCEIWIDDELFEKLEVPELEILAERFSNLEYIILNADEYSRLKPSIRLEMLSAKRKAMEVKAKRELIKRIEKQFKKGKVVRKGIEFTKTSMSYEGIVFKADKLGEYLVEENVVYREEPDFREIYEDYIDYILNIEVRTNYYSGESTFEINFKGETEISIGQINLKLSKIGNYFYVQLNGKKYRINKEDLPVVLKEAINFSIAPDGIEAYENYLSHTSKVNLKLQEALKNGGLKFILEIDKTDDNDLIKENYGERKMLLTLPLLRKNGKNYVVVCGKEYKVKNIQALFELGKDVYRYHIRNGYLQRTINLLYKGIKGITPEVIGKIIEQGEREYKKMMARKRAEERARIKKSEEFLNNAIKLTNAKKVKGGYIVRGVSGNYYFVSNDNAGVWTIKDGKQDKYLCMVDIGKTADGKAGLNDKIAKRLLALSKDKVVAKSIWDNGDKMDKWWYEISEGIR